jgi:hypothetical protein
MQTKWDFAGSTDMWSTSAGGHLMKVVNLTGFTVHRPYIPVLCLTAPLVKIRFQSAFLLIPFTPVLAAYIY